MLQGSCPSQRICATLVLHRLCFLPQTGAAAKAPGHRNDHPSGPWTPISVTKVDHIHPYVTDKFEAAKWYERLLGFQVVGELHANKYPKAPLDVANANASVKFALFSTDDPAQMGSTATIALRVAPDV